MRTLLYAMSFLAVMGLAFWAYRENYATQASLNTVDRLQNEIADLRATLAVQRAEWAYMNRPDRLRELSTINFDKLGLLPFEPEQFGQSDQVAYPAPPATFAIDGPIDVIGTTDLSGTLPSEKPEVVPTNEVQIP